MRRRMAACAHLRHDGKPMRPALLVSFVSGRDVIGC
jgi:hypothetical protein